MSCLFPKRSHRSRRSGLSVFWLSIAGQYLGLSMQPASADALLEGSTSKPTETFVGQTIVVRQVEVNHTQPPSDLPGLASKSKAISLGDPVEVGLSSFSSSTDEKEVTTPEMSPDLRDAIFQPGVMQAHDSQPNFLGQSLHPLQPSPSQPPPINQVTKNTTFTTRQILMPDLNIPKLQAPSVAQTPNQAPEKTEQDPACDPELGCLRLQPSVSPPAARQPTLYLIPRLDFFNSDNIFSLAADRNPIGDSLIRPGLTLFANPQIGKGTYLVTSVTGNLIRYVNEGQFNYDELLLRAGIFRVLNRQMSGEIGWSNQQLFIASNDLPGFTYGERFLNDQVVRIELNRLDQLTKLLNLRSFYQFRVGFADPTNLSRIGNTLFLSLGYNIQPNLQAGLDYLFFIANYTQQQRQDLYNQISARLTYSALRNFQVNIFAGYSFGSSTAPGVDYDGFTLGFNLNLNLEVL